MPWGKLGTIWSELGLDTSPLAQGVARSKALMDEADRTLTIKAKSISKSLSDIGRTLSLQVTAPLSLMGGMAAKTAMEFETAMANVWTIVDAGKETIAAMGEEVEALSFELPQTAKQLADGLYQVISASIPAQDAMGVLEVSARAAAAGLSDTFTSVDAITSVLNAYAMSADEAGRVSDIMFKTVERGKTTFPELSQNIGDVVSTAATAKVPFEELSAAIATLTKVGVRTPEAVTALNQAILTFIDPSDEAAKLAKQLGIEFSAASLASKGLYGSLQEVYEATGGNIEVLSALFPNVRALKGVLGLLRQDMGLFKGDLDTMRGSLGATDKAFEKQAQTGAHAMQIFKNQLSALAKSYGDEIIPMLVSLMKDIEPVIQAFRDLPTPVKQTIVQFGLLAAAAGPVLIVVSKLIPAISGLIAIGKSLAFGLAAWAGGAATFAEAIGLLGTIGAGPVALAIAGVAALGAGLVALNRYLGDTEGRLKRAAEAAEKHADSLKDQRTKAQELIAKIQALTNEKEALRRKTQLTKEEEERLAKIQGELKTLTNDLASIIPEAVTAYTDEGNAVIDLNKALRELLKLRKEEYTERAKAAESYVISARTEVKNIEKALTLLEKAYDLFKTGRTIDPRLQYALAQFGIQIDFTARMSEAAKTRLEETFASHKRSLLADLDAAQRELYVMTQRYRAVGTTAMAGLEPIREEEKEKKTVGAKDEDKKIVPTEPTAWELWLKKVRTLSDESYKVLKDAFERIAQNLKSGDVMLREEAEQRMSAVLSFLSKVIVEQGRDLQAADWGKVIAPALSQFVKRGYKEAEKSATALAKAMQDLRHRVIVEGLKPEEQLEAMLGLKGLEGTEEEARQLAENIAQLTEQVREAQVKSAYEQYRTESQLYDFRALEHLAYLDRLLTNEKLTDEERRKLENERALWEKRAREEAIEEEQAAKEKQKRIIAAWNAFFVDEGTKTRQQVLREAVDAAEEEYQAALKAGKGISEAALKVEEAKRALREQEKKDARAQFDFLVDMEALTTAERISQIREWLAAERENSDEWKALKREELALLKQFREEQAEATVAGLGPINKLTLEQLRTAQIGLAEAHKDAVKLGVEGAGAAKIYAAALEEVRAAIERVLEQKARDLDIEKEARYERELLSADEYIAYLMERRDAFRELSEDWLKFDRQITQVMEKEAEKRRKAHEQTAKNTVAAIGDIKKLTMEELEAWRTELSRLYDEAKAGGEEAAGAVEIYRNALIDVTEQIDDLQGKQREYIDAEMKSLYDREKLMGDKYLEYLRTQQAATEKGTMAWLRLDEEIDRVLKNEAKKRREANEGIARSVVARMNIEEASIEQLMAWQSELEEAYKGAIAQGEEGADAAKVYLQTLEQIVKAIKNLNKEQADIIDNQRRMLYDVGELAAEQYIAYLRERQSSMKPYSDEWKRIEDEITRVERNEHDKRLDAAKKTFTRQMKQVETVADANLAAAVEMLLGWRAAYAAMGEDGEKFVEQIDELLVEFLAKHRKASEDIETFLATRAKGELDTRLKLLDEEFKAKAAANVDLVRLNEWYQEQLLEKTEEATADIVKSVDSMSEEEVETAQQALAAILPLIQERVGQESKAADLIAAIQAQLNARLIALADEREEKQREARQKSIDETVRALQRLMEFHKTTGTLPWRDELTYLEVIADLDSDTREARMEGAARYYSAVRQMIEDMSEEELAALQEVLEATLVAYQAKGKQGEEMASVIIAALDKIRQKTDETADALRDRIADSIASWVEDLATGAKTFEDLLSSIGRSVLRFFVDIVAKQIATSIASSVATATKTIQGFGQMAGGVLNGVIGLLKGLGPGGWIVAGLAAIATLATVFGPKAPEVTYNPVEGYTPGTEETTRRTVTRQAVAPVSVVFAAGAIQIVNPNRIEDIVDQVGRALSRRLEDEDILFGVGPA